MDAKESKVKNFFSTHGKDIAIIGAMLVSAYFAIQTNTKDIEILKGEIEELEKNKVGTATMILKEQYLNSELLGIEKQFTAVSTKLNKKSILIGAQQTQIHLMAVQIAVQESLINQGIAERGNIWQNYNRINCK